MAVRMTCISGTSHNIPGFEEILHLRKEKKGR